MTGREASEMHDVIAINEFITLLVSRHVSFLPPTVLHWKKQGPLSVALNRKKRILIVPGFVFSHTELQEDMC